MKVHTAEQSSTPLDETIISLEARDYFHWILETNKISQSRDADGVYIEPKAENFWLLFSHGYFAGYTDANDGPPQMEVH